MPEYRVIMTKPEIGVYIELYYFPSIDFNIPARFATVGLSNSIRKTGKSIENEWKLDYKSPMNRGNGSRV